MVGTNGHAAVYENALDYCRMILFMNRSEAQRVRDEFLGDPRDPTDQRRPGFYADHVPATMRTRPHGIGDWRGQPPAHTMLAEYSGGGVLVPNGPHPIQGQLCVILTQERNQGEVSIQVWQQGFCFFLTEGMQFNLLFGLDGNIPARAVGGVLRTDSFGAMPDAAMEVHALWKKAETAIFKEFGIHDPNLQQSYLFWAMESVSMWWTQRWEQQKQQQERYRQWLALKAQFQQDQPVTQAQQDTELPLSVQPSSSRNSSTSNPTPSPRSALQGVDQRPESRQSELDNINSQGRHDGEEQKKQTLPPNVD